MHLTFVILLIWVAASGALARGAQAAVSGTVFVLLLFLCVVAHEFGHVVIARRFGGRTRDILLLPIGGVSRMEHLPERPAQELAIAVAGPAVSMAIALVLLLAVGFPTAAAIDSPDIGALLPRLAATNLFLALFNLLPAFPMDGGRALRALLAMRLGRVRATRLAARVGHVFAGLFVLLGLISPNLILLLVGIFIYFGASAEAADAELRQLTQRLAVSDVMRSNVRTIRSEASLADAIGLMLEAGQHAIPVLASDGSLAGMATKDAIIRAVHRSGRKAPVSEAIQTNVPIVPSSQKLADALQLMRSRSAPGVLAIDTKGDLAGIVTSDTLADLVLVEGTPELARHPAASRRYPPSLVSVPATCSHVKTTAGH